MSRTKVIADVYPLVVVIWQDHAAAIGWHNKEALEALVETPLRLISSLGWLYKETKDHIILVGAADAEGREFSSVQLIGKAMVKQIKVLRGKRR